jgi:hypothetical protein
MSKAKPQTVETILDWLEKATDAKLASKNNDVIASWAASGHLKQATILLGVFQVRDPLFFSLSNVYATMRESFTNLTLFLVVVFVIADFLTGYVRDYHGPRGKWCHIG